MLIGKQRTRDIQALARELVDCGADIVFGTSPHHLQPIMVYRGKVIIFGAGGYIDDYRLDDHYRNDLGCLFCCHIADGVPKWLELVPTKIVHTWLDGSVGVPYKSEVHLATGLDHEWVCSKLSELSQRFGTVVKRSDRGMRIDLQS